jgi:hypothetical protein
MIEALSCGTPVIARPCGSVPEVLRHGVTGFIGSSVDELVAAVHKIGEIPRQKCRAEFESRFTAEVMAANYEDVYHQLASMNWRNTRQKAARPRRTFADATLARYAARQWRPALNRDPLMSIGWKARGKVRQMFSNTYEADTVDQNKFDT